jgi:kynurenine formamidase
MKIIDLSVSIENDVSADPPGLGPKLLYKTHADGAKEFETLFPGLNGADLPDGEGPAVKILTGSTHTGTHLDAPWYFGSTMNHGARALTIDEVPLDWCLRPGVKLIFAICQTDISSPQPKCRPHCKPSATTCNPLTSS